MRAAATTTVVATVAVTKISMRIAVVILNWNTEEFLREFLPGLLHSAENIEGAEVVVADNASTDGSMELMAKEFPTVRTLRFEKNLGFTGGYNRAFKELYSNGSGPEYFLLINSDIEVTPDWLSTLVEWMDTHPECGACAPKLHSWQEREKFEYAGAAGGMMDRYGYPFCRGRVMKRVEHDHGQYDEPADVFWATGACLLIRSRLYQELGGLDERFFAHMEEIDLCWRLQLSGHKISIVPQSLVYHVGGGTLPATSPFKLFLNYRNNLLMLGNNLTKTFALGLLHKGFDAERAAREGLKKAKCRIRFRMMLDILSAVAYLITLNIKGFNAVRKAHGEYRTLRGTDSIEDIMEYLSTHGESAEVTGIYRKWIVTSSFFNGDKVFERMKEADYYKF